MAIDLVPGKRTHVTLSGRTNVWGVGDHIEFDGYHCIVTAVRLEFGGDRSSLEHDIIPVKWCEDRWVIDQDSPLL